MSEAKARRTRWSYLSASLLLGMYGCVCETAHAALSNCVAATGGLRSAVAHECRSGGCIGGSIGVSARMKTLAVVVIVVMSIARRVVGGC